MCFFFERLVLTDVFSSIILVISFITYMHMQDFNADDDETLDLDKDVVEVDDGDDEDMGDDE